MTLETGIILVLIGLLIFQQIFYSGQIHKLLNKLMSRNYHEYIRSEKETQTGDSSPNVKEDLDPPEDLRVLQEFQF